MRYGQVSPEREVLVSSLVVSSITESREVKISSVVLSLVLLILIMFLHLGKDIFMGLYEFSLACCLGVSGCGRVCWGWNGLVSHLLHTPVLHGKADFSIYIAVISPAREKGNVVLCAV